MPQNYGEAYKYFLVGAKKNISDCQNGLGWLYENGIAVSKNQDEAIKWYKLAAEQNHKQAQFNLGLFFKK